MSQRKLVYTGYMSYTLERKKKKQHIPKLKLALWIMPHDDGFISELKKSFKQKEREWNWNKQVEIPCSSKTHTSRLPIFITVSL